MHFEVPEDLLPAPVVQRVHLDAQCFGFDLEKGPLARLVIRPVEEHESLVSLIVHHIVTDGWSMWMLLDELRVLYPAAKAGTHLALPPLPLVPQCDGGAVGAHWEGIVPRVVHWHRPNHVVVVVVVVSRYYGVS